MPYEFCLRQISLKEGSVHCPHCYLFNMLACFLSIIGSIKGGNSWIGSPVKQACRKSGVLGKRETYVEIALF